MKITAIVTAAGNSTRFNGNKIFAKLNGEFVIQKTLNAFLNHDKIDEIVMTYNINDEPLLKELNIKGKPVIFVQGGDTRTKSVKLALKQSKCDIVLIHDGARPYVTEKIITDCITKVMENKSAICAVAVTDTITEVKNGEIVQNFERNFLYKIQTPQGFMYKDIYKAYKILEKDESYTDDSQVYKKLFNKAYIFLGSEDNIKITYKSDLK